MTKEIVVERYVINVSLSENTIMTKNVILEDSIAILVVTEVSGKFYLNKKCSLFFRYFESRVRYVVMKNH